jgi:hypothetical protein
MGVGSTPPFPLLKTNGKEGRMGLKPGGRRNTKARKGFSPILHTLPSVSTDGTEGQRGRETKEQKNKKVTKEQEQG